MFIVGIDIAKRSRVARIIDSEGQTVVKPFSIRNSCSGYNALLARMNKITNRKSGFILAIESTSHDWLALYTRLCREGCRVVLLNPIQTHAVRELLDQVFPEFETQFSTIFGNSALAVLKQYPTAEKMSRAQLGKLAQLLQTASNGRFGEWKARQLRETANGACTILRFAYPDRLVSLRSFPSPKYSLLLAFLCLTIP